uniref:hypothetical protein n=1 Tax=Microcoleus sp. CAWBG58 TaxID=2841651 RepID=UPI0025DAB1DD
MVRAYPISIGATWIFKSHYKNYVNDARTTIAILNHFLCIGSIGVLIDFGEIKFMFLGEKLKQKFDDFKRL